MQAADGTPILIGANEWRDMMPEKKIETYLGDGVYATYDRFGITLDLRGQDSTTKIFLEREVFEALVKWGSPLFRVVPST